MAVIGGDWLEEAVEVGSLRASDENAPRGSQGRTRHQGGDTRKQFMSVLD